MQILSAVDCSDLYDNAAERLKVLDNDIDKIIQDLAKNVEARGVPKNKVARQVVKELTAREVLSSSRIYEGLGIEQKRKYKKKEIEETCPQMENIFTEESSTNHQSIQVASTRTGQSETLGALREENERLKENERIKEKEKSELIVKIAYLTEENSRLKSEKEEFERQLAGKTEQVSELKRENKVLKEKTQPELLRELQERFYDKPGMLDAKQLEKISEEAGRDLETIIRRHNTKIKGAVESGEPVPMGMYMITKPDMKLVPVRVMIDFDKRRIDISLWEKKLQKS